jgi:hypothetical protein
MSSCEEGRSFRELCDLLDKISGKKQEETKKRDFLVYCQLWTKGKKEGVEKEGDSLYAAIRLMAPRLDKTRSFNIKKVSFREGKGWDSYNRVFNTFTTA